MSDEIRDVEVESEIALEAGISEDTVEIAEIIAEVEGDIPDAEGGRKGGRGPRAGGKKKKLAADLVSVEAALSLLNKDLTLSKK